MSSQEAPTRLRRVLTFPWLLLYGLGSTVGAGIYILTGVVAGRAGAWAPFAFILASTLAAFTALSFAALSKRYPEAGGALVYVRHGLERKWLSVLVGLGTASAGMVSAAAVSLGFVAYLAELLVLPPALVLAVVVFGVGGIAAWGVKESIVVAGLVTLVEVGGLIAVIVYGLLHVAETPDVGPSLLIPVAGEGPGWTIAFSSAVLCFYAFLGFEDIVNVAEEVRDVERVMPRAILWTLGISTLLYVVVTCVALLVVPSHELGRSDAPLALVVDRAGGPARLLAAVALVAMLNGALVQVVMASRVLFSLSRAGVLPAWLGRTQRRTRTPVWATGVTTLGVGGLAIALPIAELAKATASIALAVFVLVNLSLLALRLRERRSGNAVASGSILVPGLGALASLAFLMIEVCERLGLSIAGGN